MPIYPKGNKHRVVIFHRGQRHDFILDGTKAEAKQFEAAKRVEFRALDPVTAGRTVPSFSEFCRGAYRTHALEHLKKRTWSNRTYTIANLVEHFGSLKLTEIQVGTVDEYKRQRRHVDGIKASTINDELKVLRAILAYASELGVPVSRAKFKDLPTHGVKRRAIAWTEREVERLLAKVRERAPELEAIVVFLLNTGCRKGEALALEWRSVDLKRRLVSIEPSEEWQPKDGEARLIPISDALYPWLKKKGRSKRWVFPNRKGERFAYWPQRGFDAARAAAKLAGGPHTCRHTFATHFLYGNPDLHLLARLLGHSTSYVTELYSHLLPDHLAMARNVVSLGGPRRIARGGGQRARL